MLAHQKYIDIFDTSFFFEPVQNHLKIHHFLNLLGILKSCWQCRIILLCQWFLGTNSSVTLSSQLQFLSWYILIFLFLCCPGEISASLAALAKHVFILTFLKYVIILEVFKTLWRQCITSHQLFGCMNWRKAI